MTYGICVTFTKIHLLLTNVHQPIAETIMTNDNMLFLYEEIMLLALRDKEGTLESGAMYQYAVGGAILAELLLNDRIGVNESNKKKHLYVKSDISMDDPLLDECLEKIKTAKKPAGMQSWVSKFAGVKDLKHRVARQLCKLGILQADEDKVLLIFTRKIYPELNPEPERIAINRIHQAVFGDDDDIDPRTVVLVSLTNASGILQANFDKKLLKNRKDRIEQIINGELTGKAAKDAIAAMQAAVAVSCIMPALMSAAMTN